MNPATMFQRLIDNDVVSISITAMIIVFGGLVVISAFIGFLPKCLHLIESLYALPKPTHPTPEVKSESFAEEPSENNEVVAVIGLVMQMEEKRINSDSFGDIWGTPKKQDVVVNRRMVA